MSRGKRLGLVLLRKITDKRWRLNQCCESQEDETHVITEKYRAQKIFAFLIVHSEETIEYILDEYIRYLASY
jgi:hypothetical protein